jgi:hypothetical protein
MIDLSKYNLIGVIPNTRTHHSSVSGEKSFIPWPYEMWVTEDEIKRRIEKDGRIYNIAEWSSTNTAWVLCTEEGAVQLLPGDKVVILRPKK